MIWGFKRSCVLFFLFFKLDRCISMFVVTLIVSAFNPVLS